MTRSRWTTQSTQTNLHNGSHRSPTYFEWWYFHFVTAEGAALNMVVHETDIFGLAQRPYLSLTLRLPDQKPQYVRRDLAGITIAPKEPYLRVGEGMITESAWAISFDIPFPGRGLFRGEISKLTSPLVIENGVLYAEAESGRASHWLAQVSHATFTGILELDGKAHRLRGMAYQDHQWGTILIQEFVSDWVWGHFSNRETAVIFFQIFTQRGQLIERIGVLEPNGRFVATALQTNYLDTLFVARQPEAFNKTVSVSYSAGQQLSLHLAPANLMRSRLGETHKRQKVSYLRWAADATLKTSCDTQSLHGISEYIRIRPASYGELSH